MRKLSWVIFLLSFVFILGCNPKPTSTVVPTVTLSPTPTDAPKNAPQPGKATVMGQVFSLSGKPLPYQFVRLAEVIRKDGAEFYLLDIGFSPVGTADANGYFIVPDITPGEYVIIVGDPATQLERVNKEDGAPVVFNVEVDKVLDVGVIKVNVEPNN